MQNLQVDLILTHKSRDPVSYEVLIDPVERGKCLRDRQTSEYATKQHQRQRSGQIDPQSWIFRIFAGILLASSVTRT